MVFRPVVLERIPSLDEVLSISKSGLYFGAEFIRKNELEQKASVAFFIDDQDPYRIGFEFYDEVGKENSLTLINGSRAKNSLGRTVKATELFSKNKILKAIQDDPVKANRLFPFKRDKISGLFYVTVRPSFEMTVDYEKRGTIDDELIGIYRYLDKEGKVIYIGKGQIKSRASSQERRDQWGISKIQYSVLRTDEECFKWESYYIDSYRTEHGTLPFFNRISGRAD